LLSALRAAQEEMLPALRSAITVALAAAAAKNAASAQIFRAQVALLLAAQQQRQQQRGDGMAITEGSFDREAFHHNRRTTTAEAPDYHRQRLRCDDSQFETASESEQWSLASDAEAIFASGTDSIGRASTVGRPDRDATTCSLASKPARPMRVVSSGEFPSPTPRSMFVPPPPAEPSVGTTFLSVRPDDV
jgi:hypothetical protein